MTQPTFSQTDYVGNTIYGSFLSPAFSGDSVAFNKQLVFRMYQRKLLEVAVSRFKWTGLPETVDARFLELTLNVNGLAVIRETEEFPPMAYRAAPRGINNIQDNPTGYLLYQDGLRKIDEVSALEPLVPVWSSLLRYPDLDVINYHAGMVCELMTTFRSNTINMRTPTIFYVSADNKLSAENIQRQIVEGQPFIKAFDDMGRSLQDMIGIVNLGIHETALQRIKASKNEIWRDCLTMLGISNVPTDKKERLVTDEVQGNEGEVERFREISLIPRKLAAEKISKMFDVSCSVEWNGEVGQPRDPMDAMMGDNPDGGDDNGFVHTEA